MQTSFPLNLTTQLLIAVLLCSGLAATADAQNVPRALQKQRQAQERMKKQMEEAIANQPQLPSDPQLLALHREYILKAEKLAKEYERKKQYDKAREVFEAMSRLVPNYQEAEAGVSRMLQQQAMKDRKLVDVDASGGWQDSGITLLADMPVHFEVKGVWRCVLECGPEGVIIPDKMRPRDSRIQLGTLIGAIVQSPSELEKAKTFVVKPGDDFVNEKAGRLYLRMFDIDPTDNEGKMFVMVQSTFAK